MEESGLYYILDVIAIGAFSISGAIEAIKKRLDAFGVVFCSVITAMGGGCIRDLLLGNFPPAMFKDYTCLIWTVVFSVITFVTAWILQKKFDANIGKIDRADNIADAMGLGLFTIIGINTAIEMGYGDNYFFLVFLGATTGCGGGILRDVLLREIPRILCKRIYALASIAGGICYLLLLNLCPLGNLFAVICSVVLVFVLRVLASIFKWDLPKAY